MRDGSGFIGIVTSMKAYTFTMLALAGIALAGCGENNQFHFGSGGNERNNGTSTAPTPKVSRQIPGTPEYEGTVDGQQVIISRPASPSGR
jgi:hypothetical protein